MMFENKKILLISVSFFNYEKEIVKELSEMGADVDFFDDRPSNSIWHRGIIRLNKKLLSLNISRYYKKILHQIQQNTYDYFLVIKGEAIPISFIKKLKLLNPNMESICYTYDSVEEYPNFLKLIPYFDRKISFDPYDAEKYDMEFRPLFYIDLYKKRELKENEKSFDITFIGTAHTDRYLLGQKLKEKGVLLGLKMYFYYYAPSSIALFFKRNLEKGFEEINTKDVSFKKMTHEDISDLYMKSNAVLDINKPFQKGLTMRTFEVLASQTKLITFNEEIKKYPFYNSNAILVLNRDNIELNSNFFSQQNEGISEKHLIMMSLNSWLWDVFFKKNTSYWKL